MRLGSRRRSSWLPHSKWRRSPMAPARVHLRGSIRAAAAICRCRLSPKAARRARTRRSPGRHRPRHATHGWDKDTAEPSDRKQLERLDRPAGPALGGAQALGAGRPAGHRRRRQGRHDPPRDDRLQPAGLPGHVVQGADARGARPRLPVARPQAVPGARARSASSTARTTRTCSSSASTTSCRKTVWSKRYDQINDFEQHAGRQRHDDRQVLPAHQQGRAARSASRSATTTRRSAGSSRWATSRSASYWDDYMAAYEDALIEDVDRRRAVVRHPGQPQVVPQPRGRRDPGRHARGPEAGLPAAPARTCRPTSSSNSGGRRHDSAAACRRRSRVPKTPRMSPDRGATSRPCRRSGWRCRWSVCWLALPPPRPCSSARACRSRLARPRLLRPSDLLRLAGDLALLLGRRHRCCMPGRRCVGSARPAATARRRRPRRRCLARARAAR